MLVAGCRGSLPTSGPSWIEPGTMEATQSWWIAQHRRLWLPLTPGGTQTLRQVKVGCSPMAKTKLRYSF